jgi:hypothetical protein
VTEPLPPKNPHPCARRTSLDRSAYRLRMSANPDMGPACGWPPKQKPPGAAARSGFGDLWGGSARTCRACPFPSRAASRCQGLFSTALRWDPLRLGPLGAGGARARLPSPLRGYRIHAPIRAPPRLFPPGDPQGGSFEIWSRRPRQAHNVRGRRVRMSGKASRLDRNRQGSSQTWAQ